MVYLWSVKRFLPIALLGSVFFSCSDPVEENPFLLTRWELYQYSVPDIAVPLPAADTLYFDEEPLLFYNGNERVYRILKDPGNPGLNLRLQMEGTPLGNISGLVQKSMIQNGQIVGAGFSQMGAQGHYSLWLRKID